MLVRSTDDLSHVGAYSDGNAMITLEEWAVNVTRQRGNRRPWPGSLPDDIWKLFSVKGSGGRFPWMIGSVLLRCSAAFLCLRRTRPFIHHQGQVLTRFQARQVPTFLRPHRVRRTAQRHTIAFDEPDHNRFAAFTAFLQDDEEDADTANIQSNMLQINHHNGHQDDPNSARAVSIMTAAMCPRYLKRTSNRCPPLSQRVASYGSCPHLLVLPRLLIIPKTRGSTGRSPM